MTANGTGYLEFTREVLLLINVDTPKQIEEYYNLNRLGWIEMMKKQ